MAFSLRDPVLANIDDKALIIESIINHYPYLLKEWEDKQDKEYRKIAKESSDGDKEVELSIYFQMRNALDIDYDLCDIFYQSMLIMVVSYYESMITMLSKTIKAEDSIRAICEKRSVVLSPTAEEYVNVLEKEVMVLRNNVCHNNFGTHRNPEMLCSIAKNSDEIYFENGIISITGPTYVLNVLKMEHRILLELAAKLGYKNKLCSNGEIIELECKFE